MSKRSDIISNSASPMMNLFRMGRCMARTSTPTSSKRGR
jgi:hypothetical protein